MSSLHTISASPPALYPTGDQPQVANAYFAVAIDAAVDLREARGYKNRSHQERVAQAQGEQQEFLNRFSDPALGLALDLRIAAAPGASTPVSAALIGRVWGGSADAVSARAESLRRQVHADVPRHVSASPVEDAAAVAQLLAPFGAAPVDSAVITRHELIGPPTRPDAGVSYYYSAAPFNWSGNDWSAVYAALAASPVPVVVSVAVLPMQVPPAFAQTLLTLATYYGRLAREGETPAGLYHGRQRLAPDAFAVDAEKAFHDFSRRLSQTAFALRIQVSAARQLPPGIVDTVAGAISPAGRPESAAEHPRAVPAYDVRRPASVAERKLAEYNLSVVNFGMLTGRPEIWGRQDPPDPQLAMLSVLGDTRDAACAFRFPIAADGVVPGFRVRPGPTGAHPVAGAAITLGQAAGTTRDITVPLRSLTGPALIAGSAGAGQAGPALAILRQLWADHGIPFLVIDPASAGPAGYRALAELPEFKELEVITVGDEGGAPLRFNPFEVPAGMLVGEHAARLLACFDAAFGLEGQLPFVYRDALSLTYLRAGFLAAERPAGRERTWPTVVDFLAAMGEVTDGLGYPAEVKAGVDAASVRRARQLVRGVTGSAFLTGQPNDFGRLLDHPVIFELKSLGPGNEQALMMALLLNAVTGHFQSARGPSADLVHVTLVEEAHRLLARSAGSGSPAERAREMAAAAFAGTLAENREYGAGMIFAERFPGKLAADVVKHTSLRVVQRLSAEEDRRHLGATTGMDEAQRLLAARLPAGEALLDGEDFAEAVHVTTGQMTTGRADTARPGMVKAPPAPPFAACDRCRAQCAYRGAALSMVNDPGIVNDITDAAGALAQAGRTPAEQRAGLAGLRDTLYDAVGRFDVLPASEPGRGDAAFCLFLHVYASGPLRVLPAWPSVAARLLAITAPGGRERAEGLLRAADEIAGQTAAEGSPAAGEAAGTGTDRDMASEEQPTRDRPGR